MNSNKKATLLIELSVFIICLMILFVSVTKVISSQNQVVSQMTNNNNILFILDSIENKLKYEFNSGKTFSEININEYGEMLYNTQYQLIFREEGNKITILIGIFNKSNSSKDYKKILKVYKKEVLINEK